MFEIRIVQKPKFGGITLICADSFHASPLVFHTTLCQEFQQLSFVPAIIVTILLPLTFKRFLENLALVPHDCYILYLFNFFLHLKNKCIRLSNKTVYKMYIVKCM